MIFLGPGFLAAAALALPLVAIFLLKVRPRRRPVTAYFLWDRVFVEKKSSALFNRLRDAMSLLLLLLALTAAVLAAARPRPADADTRDLLVVIDDSSSMGAAPSPGGETALRRAKREAHALVAPVSEDRRGAVATLSDALRMRRFLTPDRGSLRDAIDAVRPSALPSLPEAARPLRGLAELGGELRVVLLTDASPASLGIPEGIDVISVAGPSGDGAPGDGPRPVPNAGFTAAEIVALPRTGEISIFFRVSSTESLAGAAAEVAVEHGGEPIKIIPLTLGEGGGAVEGGLSDTVVTTASGPPGPYRLRLTLTGRGPDALRADDTASLVAHAPDPVRVSVSRSARYFFENAVRAFEQSEGILRLAGEGETPDLRLERGGEPGEARLGAIVFAPSGGTRWAASTGEPVRTPIPRLVARDHPAFRFVPVESLPFGGATAVTLPEGAAVLVEDQSGVPLVWQVRPPADDGSPPGLVFNTDPARSDFFLSPYFPLIVRGAAAYLSGRGEKPLSSYATGQALTVPGLTPEAGATITGPLGLAALAGPAAPGARTAGGETGGQAEHGTGATRRIGTGERPRLTEPGYYRSDSAGGSVVLAASHLHGSETLVRPAGELPEVEGLQRGSPWWARLALAALALLVLEEILYHRRKVG